MEPLIRIVRRTEPDVTRRKMGGECDQAAQEIARKAASIIDLECSYSQSNGGDLSPPETYYNLLHQILTTSVIDLHNFEDQDSEMVVEEPEANFVADLAKQITLEIDGFVRSEIERLHMLETVGWYLREDAVDPINQRWQEYISSPGGG